MTTGRRCHLVPVACLSLVTESLLVSPGLGMGPSYVAPWVTLPPFLSSWIGRCCFLCLWSPVGVVDDSAPACVALLPMVPTLRPHPLPHFSPRGSGLSSCHPSLLTAHPRVPALWHLLLPVHLLFAFCLHSCSFAQPSAWPDFLSDLSASFPVFTSSLRTCCSAAPSPTELGIDALGPPPRAGVVWAGCLYPGQGPFSGLLPAS